MEEVILKSIAAFNNGEGGRLLIGVSDSQEILGLEDDYGTLKDGGDKDQFELHLRNLICNAFSKDFAASQVRISFPIVDDKEICEVEIKQGTKPLYCEVADKNGVKTKKFYVRSGNSSQELDIEESASYIKGKYST